MKIFEKDLRYYWKIIAVPLLILIAVGIISQLILLPKLQLIITLAKLDEAFGKLTARLLAEQLKSLSPPLPTFAPIILIFLLNILIQGYVGWSTVRKHDGEVRHAFAAGAILAFISTIVGCLTLYIIGLIRNISIFNLIFYPLTAFSGPSLILFRILIISITIISIILGFLLAGGICALSALIFKEKGKEGEKITGQRTSGLAIASLVLGIIGLVLFMTIIPPVVCSILAIIFGAIALKKIKKDSSLKGGRGLAITGIVLGIITLILVIVLGGVVFEIYKGIISGVNISGEAQGRCGDGVCDTVEQANPNLCPADCGAVNQTQQNQAQQNQTTQQCMQACIATGKTTQQCSAQCLCGDGICDEIERTNNVCPADCG